MFSALIMTLAMSPAQAVPTQLNHQGRLLDSAGAPLQGVHLLEFRLYDAPLGGALVWSEQQPVDLTEGFYTVALGADVLTNPLDDATLTNPDLYLSLAVDGGQEMARAKVSSVPYARLAGSATSLRGGPVDAAEVRVGGTLVIDATGNWVGPGGNDTLQSLNCLVDEVAVYDGAAWGCAALPSADWNTLLNMPADFMDGVDNDALSAVACGDDQLLRYSAAQGQWRCGDDANTTLSDADVIAIIANNPVTLHPATTVQWGAVAAKPPGFADNVDDDSFASFSCVDGELLSYSGGAPTCVTAPDTLAATACANGEILAYNAVSGAWVCATDTDTTLSSGEVQAIVALSSVAWGQLTGVPAGFSDGVDDDYLASLVCADGEIISYDQGTGTWACDFDAVLGALEVLSYVNGSDLDLGANSTLNGTLLSDLLSASGAINQGDLPPNGLNEVSNGLLNNQFINTFTATSIPIPDNNPVGTTSTIMVPNVGTAETLIVRVDLANSDVSGLTLNLTDPLGTTYALYDGASSGGTLTMSFPPDTPLTGDLSTWVGQNPQGGWTLQVIDQAFLNNGTDGQVNSWSVEFQHISNNQLDIQADVSLAGDLDVQGALTTSGPLDTPSLTTTSLTVVDPVALPAGTTIGGIAPRLNMRTIHSADPDGGGCPNGSRAANTPLWTETVTLAADGFATIRGDIIRFHAGRADLFLYVDGNLVDRTLTYTSSTQWEDAHVTWSGALSAGSHDVWLQSPSAGIWGCGPSWGSMDILVIE